MSVHQRVNKRIKEIGIRKVFGASALDIVSLLSMDYMKLVIIGCVVGIPIVYQIIERWLQSYAYRMPLDNSLFVLPALILVSLTALTVSIKTFQSAIRNPINSLRYE